MYSIKNLFTKSPVAISAAIIAIVNFCIVMDWIAMTAKGVASLNTALVVVLGLFVANTTSNNAVLNDIGDTINDTAQAAAQATVNKLPAAKRKAP